MVIGGVVATTSTSSKGGAGKRAIEGEEGRLSIYGDLSNVVIKGRSIS